MLRPFRQEFHKTMKMFMFNVQIKMQPNEEHK